MSREARLVLIVAVIVLLLGSAAAILLLNPARPKERTLTLKAAQPNEVLRIAIQNTQGAFSVSAAGEGYQVADIPPRLVDGEKLNSLLDASSKVVALRKVVSSARDLQVYGLASPTARVEIAYRDGSILRLAVGDKERITGHCYVRLEGDEAVYLMESARCAGFLLPVKGYIEDLLTPHLALSSPLSVVLDATFTGGPLERPVSLKATASGDPMVKRAAMTFGTATHVVMSQGHGVYELDQTYGIEITSSLLGITAKDVVGYNLSPAEIAAFGFDQPTMRVDFDIKNGLNAPIEHYVLTFLQKGETLYMTRNDDGAIYIVNEPSCLQINYEKLLVRWFLSPLLMDLKSIHIETAGEAYEFTLTGETNANLRVTCNGRDLDIERFRTFYKLLTSVAHDGRLLQGIAPQGEPLLRLTYVYRDEAKSPDVMELYPGDVRRVYVRLNGITELAMPDTYLTRVQEALAVLWGNEPIRTDW